MVDITQTDEACSPTIVDVQAGEALSFRIRNEGKKDHEFEGIDGTKVEEVLVPSGRTRSLGYTVPSSGTVQKVKCYIPGGAATIIQLNVSGAGTDPEPRTETKPTADNQKSARTTVTVGLQDYVIRADAATVPRGATRFRATNDSPLEVHELAVLRARSDGSYENLGEIEDLGPGESGEIVIELDRGNYLLACMIVPGEAGSTVDHLAEGMKTGLIVN